MAGRLIAVVGPSGVGKDSVIEALCMRREALHRVRRVITRAADAGGEDYDAVSPDQFAEMTDQGAFALTWRAHDLQYGVPVSVGAVLSGGQDAIVNLSRGVLECAQRQFDTLQVIALTASPTVLAMRLAQRGRETPEAIEKRLSRMVSPPLELQNMTLIRNDRPLEETLAEIEAVYFPVSV